MRIQGEWRNRAKKQGQKQGQTSQTSQAKAWWQSTLDKTGLRCHGRAAQGTTYSTCRINGMRCGMRHVQGIQTGQRWARLAGNRAAGSAWGPRDNRHRISRNPTNDTGFPVELKTRAKAAQTKLQRPQNSTTSLSSDKSTTTYYVVRLATLIAHCRVRGTDYSRAPSVPSKGPVNPIKPPRARSAGTPDAPPATRAQT